MKIIVFSACNVEKKKKKNMSTDAITPSPNFSIKRFSFNIYS